MLPLKDASALHLLHSHYYYYDFYYSIVTLLRLMSFMLIAEPFSTPSSPNSQSSSAHLRCQLRPSYLSCQFLELTQSTWTFHHGLYERCSCQCQMLLPSASLQTTSVFTIRTVPWLVVYSNCVVLRRNPAAGIVDSHPVQLSMTVVE